MADFLVKRDAAQCFDLPIAGDRALGQQRPDAVGVKDAGNAPLVVITAEDALMAGAVGGFVRSDQRHALTHRREVSRCCRPHQSLTNDDIFVGRVVHIGFLSAGSLPPHSPFSPRGGGRGDLKAPACRAIGGLKRDGLGAGQEDGCTGRALAQRSAGLRAVPRLAGSPGRCPIEIPDWRGVFFHV